MDWFEYQAFHRWVGLLMERHVQREISGNPLGMTWSVDPLAKVSDDALFEAAVASARSTFADHAKQTHARFGARCGGYIGMVGSLGLGGQRMTPQMQLAMHTARRSGVSGVDS